MINRTGTEIPGTLIGAVFSAVRGPDGQPAKGPFMAYAVELDHCHMTVYALQEQCRQL